MQINFLGLNCFKIQTKNALLVTDPYGQKSGLVMPRFKAEIISISNKENELANNAKNILGNAFVIDSPGEYEKNEVFIYGLEPNGNNNIIYVAEIEGIFMAHLGFLEKELTPNQLEGLKQVDILFLPASGLASDKISKMVGQIEPRIIIPMNYKMPKLKTKAEDLEKILKTLGAQKAETVDKLKISKKELPQEEMKVYILKPDLK